MAKKKSVRKWYPRWRPSAKVEKLLDQIEKLTANEQQELVDSFRDSLVLNHPCVERLMAEDGRAIRHLVESKPKKRGKPEVKAKILELAANGWSDGQIAIELKMNTEAVQKMRTRAGVKK
jgi:hypothetical protein